MSRIIRKNNENRKIPRIGVLHIGEKREITKNGKTVEIPTSLDYFKASGDYSHEFHNAYGDKPSKIEIVFMSNNFDDNINERYELRKGKKVYSYSYNNDLLLWNKETDSYKIESTVDDKELMSSLSKKHGAEWFEVLTMNFLILGVNSVFGFWSITTKGKDSSMKNIIASYDTTEEISGRIQGVKFDLRVDKVVSQKPESKNQYPVLSLVARSNLKKIREIENNGIEISGIIDNDKIETLQIENQINYFELINMCNDKDSLKSLVENIKAQKLSNENEIIEFARQKHMEL